VVRQATAGRLPNGNSEEAMLRSFRRGLAVVLSLWAAPASAVEWTVGAGVAAVPDYEGSDHYRGVPVPLVVANDLYHPETFIVWRGNQIFSNLLPNDHLRVGPYAEFIPVRDDVKNNKVDDMRDGGDNVLMLGARFGYEGRLSGQRGEGNLKTLGFYVTPRFDVLNNNGGLVTFGPVYTGAYNAGQWYVEARLEGTWASDDYMENAFGVTSADARRTGFDQFTAGSDFKNASTFLQTTYRLTDHWRLIGAFGYSRLFGDAEDSPLVDDAGDANQFLGALGAAYKF
jgi:outer membrane scaffolding protein for murein synthesis (MipA/OmpV family)